jgi:GDP-L-fucose synthase
MAAIEDILEGLSGKKILVAGSTGLMGTTALKRLSDFPDIKVRASCHKRQPRVFSDNITYVNADLRNLDDCRRVVEGIDYVFMFAAVLSTAPVIARNPVSHITGNMIMNAQMLEAAYFAGVKKFVWLSSSTGYPKVERVLREEDMFTEDPPDVYFPVGWMSRYTEVLCRQYATKLKNPMTTVVLRPTTIYGEYVDFHFETCHVLPALVRRVVERQEPIEVWGTGENTRDLIYADDVFDACLLALEKVDTFDVFNVGLSKEYSINELLDIIIETDGFKDARIVHLSSKPTTVNKRTVDLTKAKKVLGFEAKTSIREGVARMIEWYRNNPVVDN